MHTVRFSIYISQFTSTSLLSSIRSYVTVVSAAGRLRLWLTPRRNEWEFDYFLTSHQARDMDIGYRQCDVLLSCWRYMERTFIFIYFAADGAFTYIGHLNEYSSWECLTVETKQNHLCRSSRLASQFDSCCRCAGGQSLDDIANIYSSLRFMLTMNVWQNRYASPAHKCINLGLLLPCSSMCISFTYIFVWTKWEYGYCELAV